MKGRHLCALLLLGLLYTRTLPAALDPAASGWLRLLCAVSGAGWGLLLALWLTAHLTFLERDQ